MSFIRPEIVEGLQKWREVLAGVIVVAIALFMMQDGLGGRFWAGVLIGCLGLGLIVSGVPRARSRTKGGGAGVIEVDERRIIYFGPLSGGSMAVEDISRIAADPNRRWVLTSLSGDLMTIPMDAEGRDALFDAFAALPGLSASKLADTIQGDVTSRTVLWEKPRPRLG